VSSSTSKKITKELSIPTIGIGASRHCDGQVLVIDDILNLDSDKKKPKFVKNFVNVEKYIIEGVEKYIREVKKRKFPSNKNSYK
tara:strand:+ start:297 stop:548 length:252 start_codon:yes stop_codon:yes gene_type:complete